MIDANVSALAVIDERDGRIVANVSVSDIRGLAAFPRASWGEKLRLPAPVFIRTVRESSGLGGAVFREVHGIAAERIVSVRPTDVLGTAMNMLVATRMHRMWVVDRATGQPSGLISISDVLSLVKTEIDLDAQIASKTVAATTAA
jgi:CBS domain-containing protein